MRNQAQLPCVQVSQVFAVAGVIGILGLWSLSRRRKASTNDAGPSSLAASSGQELGSSLLRARPHRTALLPQSR